MVKWNIKEETLKSFRILFNIKVIYRDLKSKTQWAYKGIKRNQMMSITVSIKKSIKLK